LRGVFFFQAEDGIRDFHVTGVQTCALPICPAGGRSVVGCIWMCAAHRVTLHFSLRSCFHHHWFGQGAGALQRAWFAAVADPLPDGLAAAGPAWGGSFLQKRTVETIEAVAQFA